MNRFLNMEILKFLLWVLYLACAARATIFTATVSQDSISVGDRILFEATVIVPKGATVVPPDIGAAFRNATAL